MSAGLGASTSVDNVVAQSLSFGRMELGRIGRSGEAALAVEE